MKIAVIGLGYVGSTLAVLLSEQHDVFALDKDKEKVEAINRKESPIESAFMEQMLRNRAHRLIATTKLAEALKSADYIVIATNTQLNPETEVLSTASIESVMKAVSDIFGAQSQNSKDGATATESKVKVPVIVIKSTVPTGFTKELKTRYPQFTFLFCPEFLREKTAMEDMLNPSRIIIGYDTEDDNSKDAAERLGNILKDCIDKSVPLLYTSTAEAEAIKLFSNSYLALRVAFFNELDTFAKVRGLDSARMIAGVCMDPRIGDWYNVPGPGFGGRCLPKDTRQMIADFDKSNVPEFLVRAALEGNDARKDFTAEQEA